MTTLAPAPGVTVEALLAEAATFLAAARAVADRPRPRRPLVFHETSGAEESVEVEAAKAWQRERFDAGFGWVTGPVELGGRGLSDVHDRALRRLEQTHDLPDLSPLRIGVGTVVPTVLRFGTERQRSEIARPLMRGDLVACQLFSEPGAGSDLAAVSTSAVRSESHWRANGQKVWTSNAQFSDVGLLLARVPDSGLTMFLLRMDTPGVSVRPLRQLTGGASFNEVFLDDVIIPDSDRLGDVGSGWTVARYALGAERGSIGNRYLGVIRAAWEALLADAATLGRTAEPAVRQTLAEVHVRVTLTDQLNRRVAAAIDAGDSDPAPAFDRLMVSQTLTAIGEAAITICGEAVAAPVENLHDWSGFLLGATGMRLGGGTDEIIKTAIGERVLGLPREPKVTR